MTIINCLTDNVKVDDFWVEAGGSVTITETHMGYIGVFSIKGCAQIIGAGSTAVVKAWGDIMVDKSSSTIYTIQPNNNKSESRQLKQINSNLQEIKDQIQDLVVGTLCRVFSFCQCRNRYGLSQKQACVQTP